MSSSPSPVALDSQTIPDGPIWAREPETNRTLDFGEASGATSRHTRMTRIPDNDEDTLGSFFGHFLVYFDIF